MGILDHRHSLNIFRQINGSRKVAAPGLLRKSFLYGGLFILGLVATVLWLPTQAPAQTLDQAIKNQLDSQCANLTGGGAVAGLGPNLTTICNTIPAGPGGAEGGGTGSAQSLGATVENRRNDRLEGKPTGNQATLTLPSGFGLFISGNFESLDKDPTTFADGFDSTVLGVTAGADYLFSKMFLAGAAFNYVNRDGDFDRSGNFSTNSFGALAYGSFMPIPSIFLDVSLGYTRHDYDVDRDVLWVANNATTPTTFRGKTSSNSDGNEFSIRTVTGYDHTIGNFTIGPRVGVNYSHLTIDDYKESGGAGLALAYDKQKVKSLQSTVGLQASMAINTSYGVWVPQANANYIHEFQNDQRSINIQFAEDNRGNPTKFSFNNDNPDRNFFNFGLGTVLVLSNGIQPFINLRVMAGHSQFDNYAGTVGVRIEGS